MWIGIGIILLALYFFFIEGVLWKLIILTAGWICIYSYLNAAFPSSKETFMSVLGINISWSIFVPSLLVILAMATTRVKE